MHELSIAEAIATVASRHAAGRRVHRVEVRIGALRQVVPEALGFSWELVTAETPLAGAALEIESVAAVARCARCGAESELEQPAFACEGCGGMDLSFTAGEELSVEWIEIEERESMTGGVA